MAFQAGTQIRPELANADYSGFANAANIQAQAMMNLGEQIGQGIQEYQKNKTITATSLAQLEALAASNPDAYGAIKSAGGDLAKSIGNVEKGDYKQKDVLAVLGGMQTYVNEQQRQRQEKIQETEHKIKLEQLEALERGGGVNERSLSKAGEYILPGGTVVPAVTDKQRGIGYIEGGNFVPLPPGSKETFAGSNLSADQLTKLQANITADENAMRRAADYFKTVESTSQGLDFLADKFMGEVKTFLNNEKLTEAQLDAKVASGQLEGLIGQFRTEIVGGGVMTEQDALRIIRALGGAGVTRNKQAVRELLGKIINSKQVAYERNLDIFNNQVDSPAGRSLGLQKIEPLSFTLNNNAPANGGVTEPLPKTTDQELDDLIGYRPKL